MTLGLALLLCGLLAVAVRRPAHAPRAVVASGVVLLLAVVLDAAAVLDLAVVEDLVARLDPLALAGDDPTARTVLLGAAVWCGAAADLVVRSILVATRLPAPELAAEAGFRAGRWVGRLERWTLLAVVAAGQPALAIIPAGGKALLRYAEAVADARAARDRRLEVPDEPPAPGRVAFLDYVLVGSLTSWAQAIVLGLLVVSLAG